MDQMVDGVFMVSRYVLPLLAIWILSRCVRSMLREKYDSETWGYIMDTVKGKAKVIPLQHWEILLGRAKAADVSIPDKSISRIHAVMVRSDDGHWRVFDTFSKGGVKVNAKKVNGKGTSVHSGDTVSLSGHDLVFEEISAAKKAQIESKRVKVGRNVSPGLTLFGLTVFQLFILFQLTISISAEHMEQLLLAFAALILTEWFCYFMMQSMSRAGFEVETLAFFLTTLGMSVVATAAPEDLFKEVILILAGIILFFILGWWLRDLNRITKTKLPVAILALILLALNLVIGKVYGGARNWIEIAGFSVQPSELVKVAYIYVGAATLDRLFHTKNLIIFIVFSAICVMALALMGDFGAALIFFTTFLVISFMRSGSFATVALAISGAGLAGFLMLSIKPYIAQRFSTWRHAWDDIYGAGYQQTRAMSAAASGGLFGKGSGAGWFKDIFAADTDMVFGIICEELGLIVAICAILAVIVLAFFAFRSAAHGRSSYYVIAACATVSMMIVQLSLNVFGSMDILPFTGVTFPFVSKGGTSLLSCWALLAFIKAADTRKGASFVVKPVQKVKVEEADDD